MLQSKTQRPRIKKAISEKVFTTIGHNKSMIKKLENPKQNQCKLINKNLTFS